MKKILLFLFLTIAAILPAAAADNFTDVITVADLGIEQGATAQVTYVANPSGTEYIFNVRHYYASMTNQINIQNLKNAKGGILVTKTYGRLTKLTLDWVSVNTDPELQIYGSDTPYSTDFNDLYAAEADLGTLLVACSNTDGQTGNHEYTIESDTEYKYYAMRVISKAGKVAATVSVKSLAMEYTPSAKEACGPISISLADGTAVTGNEVVVPEPMDLLISCATEGASIAYDLDGTAGTLTDGRLRVERGGTLTLTATKAGYEPSERTITFTIPVKPIEVNAGGAVIVSDLLRAYGKTAVSLSTATPGAAISWEYDGKTGTSTDLEVEADGTLKVTAVKDGFTAATRTVEVRSFAPLTSIQAVWDAYPVPGNGAVTDPEPLTVLFDATVVYAANVADKSAGTVSGQVYITDGTNFSRLYYDRALDFLPQPGDVIAKGWTAKFARMNGWKQFEPESALNVISRQGEVPAPVAIGDEAALQALDPGTPVVVKGVTLPVATSPDVYIGDEAVKQIQTDNSPVALINAFGLPSVEAGRYDVYGLVDFYGYKRSNAPAVGPTDGDYSHRRWRVAVTEFEVWKPTSPRPVFALANDSEVDSGEPIVITCQDEAATIMYSMDGENYSEYDAANPPVMPAEDVTVSAYSRQEGYHDSAVRRVSLRYSGKAGIADITLDPAGAAEYYDLTGRRVDNPKAGMYIRVQGGRATKVIL